MVQYDVGLTKVNPAQVAPYFNKIQCFCFEEQKLAAGEEVFHSTFQR